MSDGRAGEFDDLVTNMLDNVKSKHLPSKYIELKTPEEVYESLHGTRARPVLEEKLGRQRQWQLGYTSTRCATVDAEAVIKIYFDRCRLMQNIEFVLGTPVDTLIYDSSRKTVLGVELENGKRFEAQKTIIATGAWSSRLVKLDGLFTTNAVGIVYIKLTPEENDQYKHISCHTNLVTGVNIFTPMKGWLKILRRGAGIQNTTVLKDPEDSTATYKASYPRTAYDDPNQNIPFSFETSLREELEEIFPAMAKRHFDLTRFCW